MKKVLLMFVAALMCCMTNAWALSGTGTEADPYVVADGETFTIPANTKVWFRFTAPGDGTLDLTQSLGYLSHAFMVKDLNGNWINAANFDYAGNNVGIYPLTSGLTYDFMTNVGAWSADEVTVKFVPTPDDALQVLSANPAAMSKVAEVSSTNPLMFTLNKTGLGYVRATMSPEYESDPVTATHLMDQDGMSIWEVQPTDLSDIGRENVWTLYEGTYYTLKIEVYESQEAAENWEPAIATTQIVYQGGTPAIQYSDIRLISVTPDPMNETDVENMLSQDNPNVVMEFDGIVNVESCVNPQGMWGSDDIPYEAQYTAENHTIVTATPAYESTDYYYSINIVVYEEGSNGEKLYLLDENPQVDGVNFFANTYSFDVPIADGRTIDALLEATEITPASEGYVTSLDKVTFTMTGAGDTDGFYVRTFKANAGIYNADDEKIYDVLLTQDDARAAEEFVPVGQATEYMSGTTGYFIATICELGTVDYDNVEAAVPVAITTPGVYTLKIDEQSIGDGNFDATNPWMGDQGGTKGRCNPEFNWTYTIVGEIVEVESVDPAPYNMNGGVFNDEIPAEIKITMSSENFTVASATVRYGMNTRELATTSVEGNVLTISGISEAAQEAAQVTVMISATSTDGAPIVYGAGEDDGDIILLTYQTTRARFIPVSINPQEGTVEKLEKIVIDMGEYLSWLDYSKEISVTDQAGNKYSCTFDFSWDDFNWLEINLDEPITAEGIYTLVIPEGLVFNNSYNFGYEDTFGNPVGDFYNPELTYKFTIGNPDSIENVAADANRIVKAYTVSGICVGEGTMAELKELLPAGIYIMDGQKVAVLK